MSGSAAGFRAERSRAAKDRVVQVGTGGAGSAVDPELLEARQWVAGVVHLPVETDLIAAARVRGCQVLDGGHLAVGQAVDAFRPITGVEPERARMRAHFLDLTAAQQG